MQKTLGKILSEGGILKAEPTHPFHFYQGKYWQIWLYPQDSSPVIAFNDIYKNREKCQKAINKIMAKYKEYKEVKQHG